jgi:TetR/AcrR family transcriptional repressor of lmrAB and yxaGH operons
MPAKTTSDDSRKRLISTAAKLFQEQGYAATGLTEILRGANTPKGSLYHHFPEGKSELGAAAMRAAGLALRTTFDQCYARTGHSSLAMLAFSEELSG